MMRHIRLVLLTAALALGFVTAGSAQTSLNTTTTTQAVTETASQVAVLSTTNIAVGDQIFIDHETMRVLAVTSPYLRVSRGVNSVASPHPNFSLVTTGALGRFYASDPKPGTCVRGSDGAEFLPHIVPRTGNAWDCAAGVQVWVLINPRGLQTARTVWLDLGNAGASVTDVILQHPRPINITACRVIYVEATSGTVASASVSIGTTATATDIVALTVYENAKAVGTNTTLTVNTGQVSANSPVFVKHAGVGTAQAGQAIVECNYEPR